jgi:hypothetical protein
MDASRYGIFSGLLTVTGGTGRFADGTGPIAFEGGPAPAFAPESFGWFAVDGLISTVGRARK